MVSKIAVLEGDWRLLRIEIAECAEESDAFEAFDGYSRFWCKEAVLGTYWMAEQIEENAIRIHLTDDIELEGFSEPLSFVPDRAFIHELLLKCNWEEVIRQIFPTEQSGQLSLFDGVDDE